MNNQNNLLGFIDEKINNFKNLLYELSNNKEKIKEFENNSKTIKAKMMISIMFLNEQNKKNYVDDLINLCEITNNEENFNKIESYFNMILELRESFFNDK